MKRLDLAGSRVFAGETTFYEIINGMGWEFRSLDPT
jgi:hypothetical protein